MWWQCLYLYSKAPFFVILPIALRGLEVPPPCVLGWSFVHVCSWCRRGSIPCSSAAPSLGLQLILLYHSQELLWSPRYILNTMLPKFQLAWQSLSVMVNDSWIHGWLSWLHKATSSMFHMYVNRKSGFFFHMLYRQHTIHCVHLSCFKATGRITNRKQTPARVASICVVCSLQSFHIAFRSSTWITKWDVWSREFT